MRDLIRLRGANFRYSGSPRPVLKDVSLTVREGDRILIRGPSGSGKSTLLQILAGLAPEYVAGELSGHREILYLAKGVVLQNPEAQIVTPSVEEEVAFALENSGMETSEMRSRVSGVLEGLGLSRLSGRHPLTLSGGECQRVSLAAALAVKPDILFLDEPTAYLDDGSTRRFFESLALLPERTAVVVVEHKIQAAATICETCYEVSGDGRLAQSDFRPGAALPHAAPSPRHPAPARSSPCVLEVQGLGHRFGKTGPILFSDVDLSLGRGETAALMGPSGCGKTTLLGKIAGILPSAPGVVRFDGRDSSALKEREFNAFFMYVPQNPEHMFVANSAAEELDLSGKNARELAAKFGLEARLRSSPFRLSEGEKRRLNMSVALAEERTFYLLDEPTYGLDDSTRALLVHDVRALAERGAAVLFVTHDTEFAKCVAEKIYWMEGGKISARGAGYADEVRSA